MNRLAKRKSHPEGWLSVKIIAYDKSSFKHHKGNDNNLFCGKYQSSTFEPNRNKGLPLIKESYDNNFISNLVVITNNVLLDFNNQTSRELNSNFLGTFYSWEVTNNNIETWKKRNKH